VTKKFRNNGAIGALLDEYEIALNELKNMLTNISTVELIEIADNKTNNADCKSIQSILSHVIKAGNWYAIEIRNSLGENLEPPGIIICDKIADYQEGLTQMFESTAQIFNDYQHIDLYLERKFRWWHIYNIDILLEHAIVHILRHRRQIERFVLILKNRKPNRL